MIAAANVASGIDRTILLIDDDADLLAGLYRLFVRSGWTVLRAADGNAALTVLAEERPAVVVQDLRLPGPSGLELLQMLRRADPDAAVIVLTGHGDIPLAVRAMHLGAENFLTKPVEFEQLESIARQACEKAELRKHARAGERIAETAADALGTSPSMRELARQVQLIAETDSTVLLHGETGTGKSWTARLIHSLSSRAGGPFVEVNCAGLNATFLDAELFGHEKGAFTDAKAQKHGLMEIAHRGSLFLDEVGDLAPELQPKLLKVLESRRFRRLGGTREIEVDVRLIAATHRPLDEDVRSGRFREDLYYRLSVLPVRLPPLRERSVADLAALVHGSIQQIRERLGRGPRRISVDALAALGRHAWPGNIRELRNVVERALITAGGAEQIGIEHVPAHIVGALPATTPAPDEIVLALEEVERRHIARVLQHCQGNRARAARLLGIGRRTLYDKLDRYRLT